MIIKKEYIIYKNLTKSSTINLTNENVESIDPSAFQGLLQTKSILLDSNYIKAIDASTFHGIIFNN